MKKITLLLTAFFTLVSINAQTTLTHSIDPITVDDSGVACWNNASGEYRDNSFVRSYTLSDFIAPTSSLDITSVEYGQGSADDGKLIEVAIYTTDNEDLTAATAFNLVASATHTSSSADDLSLISIPLTASIPAGSIIVFEVFADDSGTNINETFFPGFNAAGENKDSYILSNGCSLTTPTTLSSIGFPDNQYVMNVKGNEVLSIEENTISNVVIYPNPASDVINVELSNNRTVKYLELFDVVGKKVLNATETNVLNISQVTSGVYMLKVSTDKGSITKKIIKK